VPWRVEDLGIDGGGPRRDRVVVAGPGSSLTIPGIIVAEIVRALAQSGRVTRIEVDLSSHTMAGLHRAPSLAAWHGDQLLDAVVGFHAPENNRRRAEVFRDLIGPDVSVAIAYAWPGIDNSWIDQFLKVARAKGVPTAVLCASVPNTSPRQVTSLADDIGRADRVYVGDIADATALASIFRHHGPVVESNPALSLKGKSDRGESHEITAFVPKDNQESLSSLLKAFNAIPMAWIEGYRMSVVMRYSGGAVPELVESTRYEKYVTLIGDDMATDDLVELCANSSALSVADPATDSRAFSFAIDSGIATVLMATSAQPQVGQGYVGGLLADSRQPASINVALNHALRLKELRFPSPDTWGQLARRLRPRSGEHRQVDVLEVAIDS
jgi:hypothetical protein